MEFKEVVGRRRSIRFFDPDKPVEREKIQTILETARLASCAVNAHWLRAIVVQRDELPKEKLKQLKAEVTALKLAAGTSGRIDVGTFKERFGVTRKFAIPLLEYLDRERVTRRVGDARVIL